MCLPVFPLARKLQWQGFGLTEDDDEDDEVPH